MEVEIAQGDGADRYALMTPKGRYLSASRVARCIATGGMLLVAICAIVAIQVTNVMKVGSI